MPSVDRTALDRVSGITVQKDLVDRETGKVDERGVAIFAIANHLGVQDHKNGSRDIPDYKANPHRVREPVPEDLLERALDSIGSGSKFIGNAFELEDLVALGYMEKTTLPTPEDQRPISLYKLTIPGIGVANSLAHISEHEADFDAVGEGVNEAYEQGIGRIDAALKEHIHDMLEYYDHRMYKMKLLWAVHENPEISIGQLQKVKGIHEAGDRFWTDLKELVEVGFVKFKESKPGVFVFEVTKHGKDMVEEFRESEPRASELFDTQVRADLTVERRADAAA